MNSVLTRLIARGKGANELGLRPRIASRFETSQDDWGAAPELQSESSRLAPESSKATASEPQQNSISVDPTASHPKRSDPLESEASPQTRQIPAAPSKRQTAFNPSLAVPPQISNVSKPDDAAVTRQESPPKPLIPTITSEVDRKPDINTPESNEGSARELEVRVPPMPLLPPETQPGRTEEGPFQFSELPAPQIALPGHRQAEAPQAQEPPEIVVHIGRIDVRSDPAPQAPPQRRRTGRPQMTPLGDYLKSRGGAG